LIDKKLRNIFFAILRLTAALERAQDKTQCHVLLD